MIKSQGIAMYLYEQQPGDSPEGLLAVMLGTIRNNPAVAVMKLQKLAGLQVREAQTEEGMRTLTVEILSELMLTEKTRVFKVAVFVKDADNVIHGRVSDEQLGSNAGGGVAPFFMHVLGCVCLQSRLRSLRSASTTRYTGSLTRRSGIPTRGCGIPKHSTRNSPVTSDLLSPPHSSRGTSTRMIGIPSSNTSGPVVFRFRRLRRTLKGYKHGSGGAT